MKILKSLDELSSVKAYLTRVGASARSFKSAVIETSVKGTYKKDICRINFDESGKCTCTDSDFEPNQAELKAIQLEWIGLRFPRIKPIQTIGACPEDLRDDSPENIFEFRDAAGYLSMLQVRRHAKDGTKYYVPYTFWDDDQWRNMEPEGKLPLWGLNHIGDNTTAFIHEGAKAARTIQRMIERKTAEHKKDYAEHPWAQELDSAVHLGWIGGAPSPGRTDWGALAKSGITTIYIVSDNDRLGISAVADISRQLRVPTFHVQFTGEWPASFDLGDKFPEKMYADGNYIGPPFSACVHPATWATDVIEGDEGKKEFILREHFKDISAYVEESDLSVCKAMPQILRDAKILNNMLMAFSHVPDTASLILKAYSGRTATLCYRPDRKEQVTTQGNNCAINLHIPTAIKPIQGTVEPFLEYMQYMFPQKKECLEMERWIATLVGRPDIRMEFGVLLISEATGVGKTTLGSLILAPLVNTHNVGFPRETDIMSDFNGWVANKRLVIVNEIYSGQSWKAYHSLKSLITDKDITVNEKFQRPYVVENWCHIFACSNSRQAMKMEKDDRRWYYPQVNEERWPRAKFIKLREWLASGGLGKILNWARNYDNYITPGERAPMTPAQAQMIEGSQDEAQAEAAVLAETIAELEKPVALAMKDIVEHVREFVQGRVFDSDYELRKVMMENGCSVFERRIKIHGRLQYVLLNKRLAADIKNINYEDQPKSIEKYTLEPSALSEVPL